MFVITVLSVCLCSLATYNLVDSRNLGLENSDGVSDRRLGRALVVGDGSGAEGAGLHGGQGVNLTDSRDNLRKHPLIIINLYTNLAQFKSVWGLGVFWCMVYGLGFRV